MLDPSIGKRTSVASSVIRLLAGFAACAVCLVAGCKPFEVTAVPLGPMNQCEQEGIPFYLPKPLLVVAKNFSYVQEARVGLTDPPPIPETFDDQSKYADLNARASFSLDSEAGAETQAGALDAAAAGPVTTAPMTFDGVTPPTWFTYHVVFVPDLTQKYGLRIRGGPGEVRAAMNLVNGWQYTGLGPFYLKDSSTAQNVLATGIAANLAASGVADVISATADFAERARPAGTQAGVLDAQDRAARRLAEAMAGVEMRLMPQKIALSKYAQIRVFEPHLTPDGRMEWYEITGGLDWDRELLGIAESFPEPQAPRGDQGPGIGGPTPINGSTGPASGAAGPQTQSGALAGFGDPALNQQIIRNTLAMPSFPGAGTQAGALGETVEADAETGKRKHRLFDWLHRKKDRPRIIRRAAHVPASSPAALDSLRQPPGSTTTPPQPEQPGEGHESVGPPQ